MTNINQVTFTGRIKRGDIIRKIKANPTIQKAEDKLCDGLEYSFFKVSKFSDKDEFTKGDYSKITALATAADTSLCASSSASSSGIGGLTAITDILI